MIKVIYDNENVFGGKKYIVTEEETNIFTKKEKDVIKRISKAIIINPSALSSLLKKYGVEANTEDEIIVELSAAISEDNEQFNYNLSEILASPRYSYFPIAILITAIGTTLSGGLGLWKTQQSRKTQQETIEGQIRLTAMQQRESEKKSQRQLTFLIVGFALIIIMAVAYFTFKPIKTP